MLCLFVLWNELILGVFVVGGRVIYIFDWGWIEIDLGLVLNGNELGGMGKGVRFWGNYFGFWG